MSGQIPAAETRVERRRRLTRDRILRTALDLFLEKGLEATTVAEIAERADIGKGTFFTYFPTKESVFAGVTEQLRILMDRLLDDAIAAGKPVEERIEAFFRPAIEWHASNPDLSRFMVAALVRDPAFSETDRPRLQHAHERLLRELESARDRGEIAADVDLNAAIAAISGTFMGALGAWHGAAMATPLVSDFARSLQIVFRGLRP